MKTVEITISIPLSDDRSASASLILDLIAETLEDRFTDIDDIGNDEDETVADTHGFGGNVILLQCGGDLYREICL